MNAITLVRSALQATSSLFYPPCCLACGCRIGEDAHLCAPCARRLPRLKPPFCSRCAQPFSGEIGGDFTCATCGDRRLYFERALCPLRNRGVVRHLVHLFKYHHQFHLRRPLGEWLTEVLDHPRLEPFDVIVPVPLHPTRRREREYNQAEELALVLSRRCRRPVANALRRLRNTRTQTRFHRRERMENLRNAFGMRNIPAVKDRRILLVDDVFTTGSTVNECARILDSAGAGPIQVATVARS